MASSGSNKFGRYSALGNYVHYNPVNYTGFGTYWRGFKSTSIDKWVKNGKKTVHVMVDPIYYYDKAKSEAWMNNKISKLRVSEKAIIELENRLKRFTKPAEEKDEKIIQSNEQKMIDAIFELLGRITNIDNIGSQLYRVGKNKELVISEGLRPSENVYQNLANGIYNKTNREDSKKDIGIEKIDKVYTEMKKSFEKMTENSTEENIKNFITSIDKVIKVLNVDGLKTEFKNIDTKNIESFKKLVENFMLLDIYTSSNSTVTGYFGELLTLACSDAFQKKAEITTDNFITDVLSSGRWKGNQKTAPKFYSSDIVGNYKDVQNFEFKDDYNSLYKINETNDKIDVSIDINEESLNVSVKNYTDINRSIEMQSNGKKKGKQGVSLLSTLIYLNQEIPYFGTHWMNRHVEHSQKSSEDLDILLKKHMIYEAFASGTALKRVDSAQVLVLIEYSTGKVKVLSIYDILNNYSGKDQENGITLKGEKRIEDIKVLNKNYAKNPTATNKEIEQRLVKNILDLRKYKIEVLFNANQYQKT